MLLRQVLPRFDRRPLVHGGAYLYTETEGGVRMNDYGFGRYIYRLRSEAKLSQAELAARLGVTNKAVSKWEVGVSHS